MTITSIKAFFDEITDCDKALAAHCERVAMLSLALGKELNLNNANQERLYFVGLFHDIGKFNMPLEKFEECIPIVSANIIRSHEDFRRLADIIIQCHENIDGTGYPNGIKGDEIHIFATITHLCDEYDNLRIEGKKHEDAMSELRKKSDVICPKKLMILFSKIFATCSGLKDIYKENSKNWPLN